MLERFVESFILKSRARQKEILKAVEGGGMKDFSEYKAMTGKIKGLKEADDFIRSLYRITVEGIENKECTVDEDKPEYF